VPCALTVRERRRLRRPGKSDPTDALAIARITAREHDLPPARHAGQAEDLKVLSDYRDELVAQRTAEANRLHADLAIVCPGYARHCRALSSTHALHTAAQLLEQARTGSMRAQLAQRRIVRLQQLDEQLAACLTQLTKLVTATRTRLVDMVGIGPLLAARILGEVGDVHRLPTRDHFASANGTAPIPVSSGRTDRYRLNRGGTVGSTGRCTSPRSPRPATTSERAPTWPASRPRARPAGKPCGVSLRVSVMLGASGR
jgi:transposase